MILGFNFKTKCNLLIIFLSIVFFSKLSAQTIIDSTDEEVEEEDSINLKYPIRDRYGDFYSQPSYNSFDIFNENNSTINKSVIYNPKNKNFLISEKVQNINIRPQISFDNSEMNKLEFKKADELYFMKKVNVSMFLSQRGGIPRFSATYFIFNNIFGVNTIGQKIKEIYDTTVSDIKKIKKTKPKAFFNTMLKPLKLDTNLISLKIDTTNQIKENINKLKKNIPNQDDIKKAIDDFEKSQIASINPKGFVDFIVGAENFSTNNPSIPINLRSYTVPLLDLKYDVNLNSTIGSKLSLPISASNLNNFDFRNPLYVVNGVSAAAAVAAATNAVSNSANAYGGISGINPSAVSSLNNPFGNLQQSLKRIKIAYKGDPDQIIKKIELGVTQFETKSNIIPSTKDLFGASLQMQFGKLSLLSTIAYQTSKLKTINLNDGSLSQNIRIKAADYEDNKNFLMAHYFRKKFNSSLKKLPLVESNVRILRVEVWVTNRNATTTDTREVIAFTDLAECGSDLTNPNNISCLSNPDSYPDNSNNSLYNTLKNSPTLRNSTDAIATLTSLGFVQGKDYEKVYAKKVNVNNLYFHPNLGVIFLNESVTNESVVAISYEYQVDGKVYRVGEFSEEVALDNNKLTKLLFTKLLKTIIPQPYNPIWKLMMKNVYSLGTGNIKKENFNLNVFYDEPANGEKIYLPYADPQYKKTIVSLINSDRLNNNNDFISDGIFDYVENVTVLPDKGKIMFPVLEPFGKDLEYVFTDRNLAKKYLFYSLYDSIKSFALQQIQSNRFLIKGTVKNSNSSQIFLGAYNIPQGSVKITQSGTDLQEGKDFIIDYNIGALTITNKSILDSKLPLLVRLEDNSSFSFQQKTFLGLRAEYALTKDINIGATYTKLNEIPLNNKVLYGQEAINNQLYGVDFNYKIKTRALSYFLDKALPIYVTKEISNINIFAEIAQYNPNYNTINSYSTPGSIYLDDFESSYSNIALNNAPSLEWNLSSVPKGARDKNGIELFPESNENNSLTISKNRARLAWYQIDQNLLISGSPNNPITDMNYFDPRWRIIPTTEVFPSTTTNYVDVYARSFDLAFYPSEKGAYNFETSVSEINEKGVFLNPNKKFGGISFGFQDQSNFEDKNISYIQFWMQDPFINNPNSNGGDMYFNLGNISEDILNDNQRSYENGINTPSFPTQMSSSIWGQIPTNPTPVSNNFINISTERILQDVGLDGISDILERTQFKDYLTNIAEKFGTNSIIYQNAINDPSADNFRSEREPTLPSNANILERYKYYNNTQGNSQIPTINNTNSVYASTSIPDKEDLNNDNILNLSEDYFQYNLKLKPNMQIGDNNGYIVDKRVVYANIQLVNESAPTQRAVTWYLMKIPINSYYAKAGNIQDFKSIRFMRMFLTNFNENVVVRMLKFGLVSNNWRPFNYAINNTGNYDNTIKNENLFVSTLGIEENNFRYPIPYVLPPQIERVQQTASNSTMVLQNEQSMSIRVNNLKTNEPRGVFKNMALNLINYGKINMFIHAEAFANQIVRDGEVEAVIRLATDYVNNYYEIRIPLKITPFKGTYIYREEIWPIENNLDIDLNILTQLKEKRNLNLANISQIFTDIYNGKTISIIGNPSLANITGILIGVNNKSGTDKSVEIWVDELRLSDLNLKNANAGYTKIDFKLADLGTMSITGSFHTSGFGTLEQKVNDRSRDNFKQYNITSKLDLSKLLPDNIKMNIPFYMNFGESFSTPEYDPFNSDLKLEDKLNLQKNNNAKTDILNKSIDYTKTQTYSLTNIRVLAQKGELPAFYSIKNWEFSYTFSSISKTSPLVEIFDFTNYNASAVYTYNPIPHYLIPFKKIKSNNSFIGLIKNFNINFIPSNYVFKTIFDRKFTLSKARNIYEDPTFILPEYFDKRFTITRDYATKLNLTKTINIDFKATNLSLIDEPLGQINNFDKTLIVWKKILNGGRNIIYKQDMIINYIIPLQQIPTLNWVNTKIGYSTSYIWTTASDSLFYLGHTIQNQNKQDLDLFLDFEKFFKRFNISKPRVSKNISRTELNVAKQTWWQSLLFGLQRIRFNINDVYSSTVNGFMFTPQILGNNLQNLAPGLDYVFGSQPSPSWLENAANNKWLTNSTSLNQNYLQSFSRNIEIDILIKPLPYLDIQLLFNYSFGKNYSELYKDITGNGNFQHLNPFSTGKFQLSYWAFNTLFDNYASSSLTRSFKNFLDYRTTLSERIAKLYNITQITEQGYYKGFDQYAQSVLIPSFIAAYTGKSPTDVPLINNNHNNIKDNPFSDFLPLPNWKITYYGLIQIPGLNKIFSIIKLTNNYSGNLNSNEISINPQYFQSFIGIPMFIDPISGNLMPYYRIPNITITDRFEPLTGIDLLTKNQIGIGFKYTKDRTASISLVDFQISENYKEQYNINFSFKVNGLKNWNKLKKSMPNFKNEFIFKFDMSYSQDYNFNIKLNQEYKTPTGGNTLYTIMPSIEYITTKVLTFKLFYEYRAAKNNLTQLENINQKGGLLIRLSFD